jgi:hypothetical protein
MRAIYRVHCHNYLGLIIDSIMNWLDHTTNAIKKISSFIGMIFRTRKHVDMNILKLLYFAYVQSHLVYLLPIWGGSPNIYIEHICKLQNKILRIINFQPYRHRNLEFILHNLLPFRRLIEYATVLLIHKIKYKLINTDIQMLSYIDTSGRTTRRSHQRRPPNFIMRLSQDRHTDRLSQEGSTFTIYYLKAYSRTV